MHCFVRLHCGKMYFCYMEPFLKDLFLSQNYSDKQFFLLAGPCVMESEDLIDEVARQVSNSCKKFQIPYVFKASYRKANRTSNSSFTGVGDERALKAIFAVGKKYTIPTVTDIHTAKEAALAAQYVDILQIPAFLCRQTDLLEAAGRTGKIVNVKKGQFLSGESMKFVAEKIQSTGNDNILLTERGTTFGYQDLVVDMRNIPWMKQTGYPVVMDVTHSLQQPNQPGGITGGNPQLIETIAMAAIAAGADGLFIETHPQPDKALSDGANMLPLHLLEPLLEKIATLRACVAAL